MPSNAKLWVVSDESGSWLWLLCYEGFIVGGFGVSIVLGACLFGIGLMVGAAILINVLVLGLSWFGGWIKVMLPLVIGFLVAY